MSTVHGKSLHASLTVQRIVCVDAPKLAFTTFDSVFFHKITVNPIREEVLHDLSVSVLSPLLTLIDQDSLCHLANIAIRVFTKISKHIVNTGRFADVGASSFISMKSLPTSDTSW